MADNPQPQCKKWLFTFMGPPFFSCAGSHHSWPAISLQLLKIFTTQFRSSTINSNPIHTCHWHAIQSVNDQLSYRAHLQRTICPRFLNKLVAKGRKVETSSCLVSTTTPYWSCQMISFWKYHTRQDQQSKINCEFRYFLYGNVKIVSRRE